MSKYDWLLLIHVAAAFAIVTALVLWTVLILASRGSDASGQGALISALARPASILFTAGGLVVLVFGIWLAIDLDYGVTDEWVIGAIVLWVIASFAGMRAARALSAPRPTDGADVRARSETRQAVLLHLVNVAAVLGLILLMVFKPGAF